MKILVTSGARPVIGGTETYLRWLLGALVAKGHTVTFAYELDFGDPKLAIDFGLEGLERWSFQNQNDDAILERAARLEPDVYFANGGMRPQLENQLLERFPSALFLHTFTGACATGTRLHRLPTLRSCTRTFGVACLAVNYLRGCGARRPDRLLESYLDQRTKARGLRLAKRLVVASDYVRGVYEAAGVDPRAIHVVPYPTLRLEPTPEPPEPRPPTDRVLFMGRVTRVKGLDHAILAVQSAGRRLGRKLALHVLGVGPELAACQELAERTSVELRTHGWLDGDAQLEILRSADVLIVPSLWPEPFGIVGIEAACVGVPSVAYEIGGIRQWLRPGESGETARGEPPEPSALSAALVRALESRDHLQALRVGAWRAARDFGGDRHLAALERVFQSVAGAAGAVPIGTTFGARSSAEPR